MFASAAFAWMMADSRLHAASVRMQCPQAAHEEGGTDGDFLLVQEQFEEHVQNTEAQHAAALDPEAEQFAQQLAQKDAELQEAIAQACAL